MFDPLLEDKQSAVIAVNLSHVGCEYTIVSVCRFWCICRASRPRVRARRLGCCSRVELEGPVDPSATPAQLAIYTTSWVPSQPGGKPKARIPGSADKDGTCSPKLYHKAEVQQENRSASLARDGGWVRRDQRREARPLCGQVASAAPGRQRLAGEEGLTEGARTSCGMSSGM